MKFVDFIFASAGGEHAKLLFLASVAGLTGTLTLVFINVIASADTVSASTLVPFLFSALTHIGAARYTTHRINRLTEEALHRLKSEMIDEIAAADFAAVEHIGPTEIQDRLTQNMNTISNRASSIGSIVQSLAMFLGALLYLAHLSRSVFLVIGPLLMLLLYSYVRVGHGGDKLIQRYIDARLRFLDLLTGLLKGVKELKLSRKRQREVLADYDKASNTERHVAVEINRFFEDTYLFLNVSLYSLLAALIFCVPLYMHIKDALLAQLVVVILFLWGSIQEGLSAYPGYVRAGQALESISTLRKRLVAASAGVQSVLKNINRSQPPRIEARDLEYEYPTADNNKSFRVGPFSLSIEPGELLFIVGGNGSGKSTILKVLIGLYRPSRGQLLVDGHQVWNAHVAAYREQISSIFTDFHLFARLYGVLGADPVVVTALLKKLGIDHKTAFVKGRFTERRLSTGQRKRLAMVVTLLEDRPIVVLDEWAADQDPGFRQWFYEELLPEQKRRGKTVIAISHDDRYFHCADRVVTLDYGTVRSIVDNRGARPVE